MYRNLLVININNLINNILTIKHKTAKKIMVVLKSNAYNMGVKSIIKYVKNIADFIVFNKYCEYLECIDLLKDSKVLILEEVPVKYLKCLENNVRVSINSKEYIYKVIENNPSLKVHIQVDTMMNRDGIKSIDELNEIIAASNQKIEIEGIYTHFISDKNEFALYKIQQEKFKTFVERFDFQVIHTAATSSLSKDLIGNYVRCGMAIYGHHTALNLLNVVNAYVPILNVRESKKGSSIGYGATYTSDCDELIGVLPVGYYEGFNGKYVYKGNKVLSVVGKICMNHTFVKLDNTIKNSSWLNIFPKNDKIEEVNYYHVLTGYKNFKRIYIMEYQNDFRKIFKETNKKGFILRKRTRSN